jgi:hypothetical protein
MQVNPDLESRGPRPANSTIEDIQLSTDKRVAVPHSHGPVSDRNADMVQARSGDLVEVVGGDEIAVERARLVREFGREPEGGEGVMRAKHTSSGC